MVLLKNSRIQTMTHGSLFSGIGGFDLAAQWMGWENVFHCEWNDFGKRVLKYYWPNAKSYEDIKQTNFNTHRGRIDVLTGGFPCQPYSNAGSRKGKEDERHLWPEMLRAIDEIKPRWIVGENVSGITSWNEGLVFEEIQADLEVKGYEVQPLLLPAISIGADHIRERVWFIAYSSSLGRKNVQSDKGSSSKEKVNLKGNWKKVEWWKEEANVLDPSCNTFLRFEEMHGEPPIFSVDDGISLELDGITIPKWTEESLTAAGNAIVPQLVHQIFKVIEQIEQNLK